ncbi:MAG TPA: aryl-sulfate sulfotransferase, partial [Bacteroidota bacterium]|nr:aryl-sulfate sulfotransferase [Bacteroidota bacterium]
EPETINMNLTIPGAYPNANVIGGVIQELDRNKNVVFQWRSFDHFQVTDATHEDLRAKTIDYVHPNSLDVDTDGNLLLSSRSLDEVTKINRTNGSIIWRLGGKNNQFTFLNDPIGFSHQHSVRRTQTGTILMFDNGNYHAPQFSRAVEYSIDENAKTVSLTWQFRHNPDLYALAMASVQRLANGNTVIGWGSASTALTEVRPDGSTALELAFPQGIVSYRALRYSWNAPYQPSYHVLGSIQYGPEGQIPVASALVTLTPKTVGTPRTMTSDQNGTFDIPDVGPGDYSLGITKVGQYPGWFANAADALLIGRYLADSLKVQLGPLQKLAADVNGDGIIGPADILEILSRFVGVTKSFPRGDWVIAPSATTLTVVSDDLSVYAQCLAVGDVNGDAMPSGAFFKAHGNYAGSITLTHDGPVIAQATNELDIPVYAYAAMSIGSISLCFKTISGASGFLGVTGPSGMMANPVGNDVIVAWCDARQPLNAKPGDVLFVLRFKADQTLDDLGLTLDQGGEITDGEGVALQKAALQLPLGVGALPVRFELSQNYPNPFNPSTKIRFSLPEQADISLQVFDVLGRKVATLAQGSRAAGTYTVQFDASQFASGAYYCVLLAGGVKITRTMTLLR